MILHLFSLFFTSSLFLFHSFTFGMERPTSGSMIAKPRKPSGSLIVRVVRSASSSFIHRPASAPELRAATAATEEPELLRGQRYTLRCDQEEIPVTISGRCDKVYQANSLADLTRKNKELFARSEIVFFASRLIMQNEPLFSSQAFGDALQILGRYKAKGIISKLDAKLIRRIVRNKTDLPLFKKHFYVATFGDSIEFRVCAFRSDFIDLKKDLSIKALV